MCPDSVNSKFINIFVFFNTYLPVFIPYKIYRVVKGKFLCNNCRPEVLKLVGALRGTETGRAGYIPSVVDPLEVVWQ